MEFSHVFYKELPLDNDNIFSANLTENNKVERIKFDKSKVFAISGLSIDQTVDRTVLLPNTEWKKADSEILRTYAEEKKS